MFNLSDTIARTCKWMWGICLQCKMSYKFVLSVLHSVTATVVSLLCTSRWRDAQTTELTDLLNAKSDLENILLLFKLSVSQQVLAAAEPLGDLINTRLTRWHRKMCFTDKSQKRDSSVVVRSRYCLRLLQARTGSGYIHRHLQRLTVQEGWKLVRGGETPVRRGSFLFASGKH